MAMIRKAMMRPSLREWSDAIGRDTFSPEKAGRVVYLAIDEEEIGRIGLDLGLAPETAYESFRASVIDEVRYGWPYPCRSSNSGEIPVYLAVLAAQVVAAFQMHDDDWASGKAYWIRLREFLGQSSENKMPEGLKHEQHAALWKGLAQWANVTNGGRLGRVRLVEKKKGHRFVAEPLGQCLLRRADLEKLQELFAERGRPDPALVRGRWLRELVDDARLSLPGRYFTKHGLRVLDDSYRSDTAWEQVEAEYERFLGEKRPEAVPRPRPLVDGVRRPRLRTIVRLQIGRRGLSGVLYHREGKSFNPQNPDVGEVLRRCYLRAGREGTPPPHKPPHGDFLLATRTDEFGAFTERRVCRAGDDVLLLVPDSHGQAWLDDADDQLFVGEPRRYRPSLGADRPGWAPLEGLPVGWLALRFRTGEDLSDVTLDGKWIGAVDRRASGLRAVGGLILRRGVWMLGAGPTVRVVGPVSYDRILIDGEPHPLDASRCATPAVGVGLHLMRLPNESSRTLRIRIQAPRRAKPTESAGWHWVEDGWAISSAERRRINAAPGSGTLQGARLAGDWPARRGPEPEPVEIAPRAPDANIPDELAALILTVHLRLGGRTHLPYPRLGSAARAANPLLRGMLRAGRPGRLSGRDEI